MIVDELSKIVIDKSYEFSIQIRIENCDRQIVRILDTDSNRKSWSTNRTNFRYEIENEKNKKNLNWSFEKKNSTESIDFFINEFRRFWVASYFNRLLRKFNTIVLLRDAMRLCWTKSYNCAKISRQQFIHSRVRSFFARRRKRKKRNRKRSSKNTSRTNTKNIHQIYQSINILVKVRFDVTISHQNNRCVEIYLSQYVHSSENSTRFRSHNIESNRLRKINIVAKFSTTYNSKTFRSIDDMIFSKTLYFRSIESHLLKTKCFFVNHIFDFSRHVITNWISKIFSTRFTILLKMNIACAFRKI